MDTIAKCISRLTLAALSVVLVALLYGCGGGSSAGADTPPQQPMPGSLDTSFGSGGIVVASIGLGGVAIAVQADGKIVAAGTVTIQNSTTIALFRYAPDGSLDTTFGTGGTVTSSSFISSPYAVASGVALQTDGKIVVAGYSRQDSLDVCTLARLNPDGSPDVAFGHGGAVVRDVPVAAMHHSRCSSPVVLSNGDIVVGVATTEFSGVFPVEIPGHLGLMRFRADGALDPAFGVGGVAVFQTTYGGAGTSAVVLQPDGRIVVGGWSVGGGSILPEAAISEIVIARFDAGGGLDPAFGQGGVIQGSKDQTRVVDLALQADGKIVVAVGVSYQVRRLLPNGAPDPGFRVGGALGTFQGAGVALQSNGKVIYAGTIPADAGGEQQQLALWRLGPDGAPDSSFGTEGLVTTRIGKSSVGFAAAIQQDGRIVVAGASGNFVLVRYFGDPVTEPSR